MICLGDLSQKRVNRCLQGGADASGYDMNAHWVDPPFCDMLANHPLLDLYVRNAMEVGRHPLPEEEDAMVVAFARLA